ncbi:hypothetical protein D3C85_1024250 [compost metagenome]
MAQACEGQNVQLDQVLFMAPVLGEKRPVRTDRRAIDQQVDLPFAFLQFQQETGEAQRLTQVASTKQYFHSETLSQFNGDAFQQVTLPGHQNKAAPPAGEGLGHGQAEAAGGAGDQSVTGHAVLQAHAGALQHERCRGQA